MSEWPGLEPGSRATPDDPVLCYLCGKDTSVAMIASHLIAEHDFDPDDLANAPIVALTDDEAAK